MSLTIYLLRRHNALFSQKMRRWCAARNRYQLISCLNALQTIWKQLNSRVSVFQHRPCKRGTLADNEEINGTRRVTIVAARKLLHDDEINSATPTKKNDFKQTKFFWGFLFLFFFFVQVTNNRGCWTEQPPHRTHALMYATTFIVFFVCSFVLFIRKAIVLQYPAG